MRTIKIKRIVKDKANLYLITENDKKYTLNIENCNVVGLRGTTLDPHQNRFYLELDETMTNMRFNSFLQHRFFNSQISLRQALDSLPLYEGYFSHIEMFDFSTAQELAILRRTHFNRAMQVPAFASLPSNYISYCRRNSLMLNFDSLITFVVKVIFQIKDPVKELGEHYLNVNWFEAFPTLLAIHERLNAIDPKLKISKMVKYSLKFQLEIDRTAPSSPLSGATFNLRQYWDEVLLYHTAGYTFDPFPYDRECYKKQLENMRAAKEDVLSFRIQQAQGHLPTLETEELIIRPLLTNQEFVNAGTELRNCVASYVERVTNKNVFVIGVYNKSNGKIDSAISINWRQNMDNTPILDTAYISQHLTIGNNNPSTEIQSKGREYFEMAKPLLFQG